MKSLDHNNLLHNMSAPPKTVIRYAGLPRLGDDGEGSADRAAPTVDATAYGRAIRVALPAGFDSSSPAAILQELSVAVSADPAAQLVALINQKAEALPLPDACLVIAGTDDHPTLWPDALSALAILTKSSEHIWLRAKNPRVYGPFERQRVSLLVPPTLAHRLQVTRT